ncbi:type II toxin-antitoxin system RelE family toxin [Methanospirillum stamsii]|uniref:Plasmid stabilization protein n=1 Tax=Methanospirillum stamsii TaxID=1277351 RepID=A0A2V2N4C7_9EURY|nr:type II toxin-antitoxin system RelE/ParE family toxin [Methanospirillum stamsii]PWR73365.1 plasmid stabilization protein [Methanospirillum stamsii]
MYSLKYSNRAEKALKNLDHLVGKRIYTALEKIREDPRSHVEMMEHSKFSDPLYKYRIGDYRVIMSLFDNELIVLVVDIGPRKSIYKKYGGKG